MKHCTKCKEDKEETEFYFSKEKYSCWCKECVRFSSNESKRAKRGLPSTKNRLYRIDPEELFQAQMQEILESNRGYV